MAPFLFVFSYVALVVDAYAVWLMFNQFYQVGWMVFWGGHVVLPLLDATVGDGISAKRF